MEAADGRHQHPVIVPLGPEPLDMLGEEECDVLHELLAREVIVSSHLQSAEHFVQEALVHVHGDQREEVVVKQREHLVPHTLLDF